MDIKACFPPETALALGTQREQKQDDQHEIYMPNANTTLAYPTQTIFHRLALVSVTIQLQLFFLFTAFVEVKETGTFLSNE